MTSPNRRKIQAAVLGAGLLVVGTPHAADAASNSTTMLASAAVVSAALVSTTPLAFGSYNSVGGAATTGTSTVLVTATTGTTYTVGIDAGSGAGATVANRKLTNGPDALNYAVYRDAARTALWGDTAGTNTVSGTGSGLPQTLTTYGNIPADQNVAAGLYTDTLTVTVTY